MDKCANACNYFISESESSEDEFHELGIVIKYIRWILRQCLIPCSPYLLQIDERGYIRWLLSNPPEPFHQIYKMHVCTFLNLCNILKDRRLLKDTKLVSVEEQLVIFLG